MLRSPTFRLLLHYLGLPKDNPAEANEIYLQKLVNLIRDARYVQRAVVLGMDGVYDDEGRLDEKNTEFLVSNDYVFKTVERFPQYFKAGVSINPKRRDALEELQRCVHAGAVLVKVLPNSQRFNLSDKRFIPFFRSMADARIPLLCHVGYEFSLRGKEQSLGDPNNLRLPLDQGVNVIAAHGMSHGLFWPEKYWNTFREFVSRYANFYWDASALSLPSRVGMLLRLRHHPEIRERMFFGTDYPLPVFAYPALLVGHWKAYWRLKKIQNPFDRYFMLLQDLGFDSPTRNASNKFLCD